MCSLVAHQLQNPEKKKTQKKKSQHFFWQIIEEDQNVLIPKRGFLIYLHIYYF